MTLKPLQKLKTTFAFDTWWQKCQHIDLLQTNENIDKISDELPECSDIDLDISLPQP